MAGGRKRLLVVGNGRLPPDACKRIETADAVMRFNQPPHSVEEGGRKTDFLLVSNAGKPMQWMLQNPSFPNLPAFVAARKVVFSYSPEVIRRYHPKPNLLARLRGQRSDWTEAGTAFFEKKGKPVTVIPTSFYLESCDLLGIAEADRRRFFPSSGFLGFRYGLHTFPAPEWKVEIVGFSWEGWSKHPWSAEREWIQRHIEH